MSIKLNIPKDYPLEEVWVPIEQVEETLKYIWTQIFCNPEQIRAEQKRERRQKRKEKDRQATYERQKRTANNPTGGNRIDLPSSSNV